MSNRDTNGDSMARAAFHAIRGMLPAACVLVGLAVCGCAAGPPKSGFLEDYSGFERVPPDSRVWSYVDPTGFGRKEMRVRIWRERSNLEKFRDYDRVLIDPIEVRLHAGAEATESDRANFDEVLQYARDHLVAALEDKYPIVKEPGPGVVRFRGAITDAFSAYRYPTRLWNEVSVWANSAPGGAAFEFEMVDSTNDERIVAVVASVRGNALDTLNDKDGWDDFKRGSAGLARFIRKTMDEFHDEE